MPNEYSEIPLLPVLRLMTQSTLASRRVYSVIATRLQLKSTTIRRQPGYSLFAEAPSTAPMDNSPGSRRALTPTMKSRVIAARSRSALVRRAARQPAGRRSRLGRDRRGDAGGDGRSRRSQQRRHQWSIHRENRTGPNKCGEPIATRGRPSSAASAIDNELREQ